MKNKELITLLQQFGPEQEVSVVLKTFGGDMEELEDGDVLDPVEVNQQRNMVTITVESR